MSEQKHTPEKCEPSPLGLPMRPVLIRNDEMGLLSTPGPWKIDNEEYCQYVFGPNNEMICQMRGWGAMEDKAKVMSIQAANCKLIARAPELLQQVAELTKENERLKEDKTNLETSVKNLVEMYEEIMDVQHTEISQEEVRRLKEYERVGLMIADAKKPEDLEALVEYVHEDQMPAWKQKMEELQNV